MIMSGARKVGVVGAGLVGSSFAYALMIYELATEMVLVDVNGEKAVGEIRGGRFERRGIVVIACFSPRIHGRDQKTNHEIGQQET